MRIIRAVTQIYFIKTLVGYMEILQYPYISEILSENIDLNFIIILQTISDAQNKL